MAQTRDIGLKALRDQGFDLHGGEEVQDVFQTRFLSFMQRSLVIGILTTLGFGLVPGLSISFAMQVGLALMIVVVWFFVFDEWQEWRDRGADVWILTNHRLILINPREDVSASWWNLSDIHSVRRVFWWALRVRARDGRATLMRYVGPLSDVRARILAAKEGAQNV